MRVTPVSADLLIKLALAAAVIGAGVYAVRKVTNVAGPVVDSLLEGAGAAANAVNPTSNENVFYRAANVLTGGGGSTTDVPLGVRIYEALPWHTDPMKQADQPREDFANYNYF